MLVKRTVMAMRTLKGGQDIFEVKDQDIVKSQRKIIRRAHSSYSERYSTELYIDSQTVSYNKSDDTTSMFFSNGKKDNGAYPRNTEEAKPSLMSLIHGKHPDSKENRRPFSSQQPLLAVVKNNMCLRRSSGLDSIPKSPLYRNMRSPVIGRSYSANSPIIGSPNIYNGYNSPVYSGMPSQSVYANTSYQSFNEIDAPINGLEVHGSYFINKSLLHEDEEQQIESFSLVNKNFNSPYKSRVPNESLNGDMSWSLAPPIGKSRKPHYCLDQTSTEAVVSALKDKSKRKRQVQSSQENVSSKKIKFSDDTFDSTLHDLFPTGETTHGSPLRRRRMPSRSPKKRLVTTSTQYETTPEDEVGSKKMKNMESPGRSKFGLSEDQTDELMDRTINTESSTKSEKFQYSTSLDSPTLESAVEHVKDSLKSYPSSENKKVSFQINSTVNENDGGMSSPSVKKVSALKNLKSPYKKLLNTSFPSNLRPGSTEKRRKHPVYFTAKIDIDEIQNNREEYGTRGASLKAFRLDQEEAARRVNDLLDDTEQVDFTIEAKVSNVTATSNASLFNVSSLNTTTKSNEQLSTLKQPVITTTPTILLSSATPSFTANVSSTGAPSGFTFPTTNIATSTTLTSISTILAATKSVSFSTSTQPTVGFSFGVKTTSSVASTVSSKTPVSSTNQVTGFSFGSTNVSAVNPPPTLSASTTGFTFGNATASSSATSSNQPPFQFVGAQAKLPSTSTATTAIPFSLGTAAPIAVSSQPTAATNISYGFNTQPTNSNISGVNQAVPSNVGFSFGVKTQMPATTSIQSITIGATQPSLHSFGGIAKPATTVNKNLFGPPSTTAFSLSASSTTTTNSVNTFSTVQSSSTLFGTSSVNNFAAAAQPTSQPPNFAVTQSSNALFGSIVASSTSTAFPNLPTQSSTGFTFPKATSSSSGFNFVASGSAQNLFAAPSQTSASTASSVFGAPPTTQNLFGNPSVTTNTSQNMFGNPGQASASSAQNLFGTTSSATQSVFGITTTTQSGFGTTPAPSIFGAPSTSTAFHAPQTQNTTQSLFGAAPTQNTTQSFFGAPAAKSDFGSVPSQNAFGNTNHSTVFGQQPSKPATGFQFGPATTTTASKPTGFSFGSSTQSSAFGQPAANTFGLSNNPASIFGSSQAAAPTPFGSSTTGSGFGAPVASAAPTPFGSSSTGSVFGAPAVSAPAANPFGQQTSSGFDFSSSLKQGPALNFGAPSNSAFAAQPMAAAKPFNFTNQPATPSFGSNPGTPSFGTPQQPSFGTPNFNTPTAGSGFTIGAAGNPAGRQTQRARRRLRK